MTDIAMIMDMARKAGEDREAALREQINTALQKIRAYARWGALGAHVGCQAGHPQPVVVQARCVCCRRGLFGCPWCAAGRRRAL